VEGKSRSEKTLQSTRAATTTATETSAQQFREHNIGQMRNLSIAQRTEKDAANVVTVVRGVMEMDRIDSHRKQQMW
jgi:hypothetical protein